MITHHYCAHAVFPPTGQVLGQGARINEERRREVATQTGNAKVEWVINNLSRPITRSNVIGLHVRRAAGSPAARAEHACLPGTALAAQASAGDYRR